MKTASLLRLPAVALAVIAITQCAHIERPPGGPEDETPPILTAVFPRPGSVNQPLDLNAKVAFSEWMIGDAGNDIFISPALPRKLKIKAGGKFFEVGCESRLDSATTYILTVQSALSDLNNLHLKTVFNLVFSTGASLDTAGVRGMLLQQGETSRRMLTGLFPLGPSRLSLRYLTQPGNRIPDSLPHPGRERPMYLIAADSTGNFSYRGIRPASYAMLAFEDKNKNLRPDFGTEDIAMGQPSLEIPAHNPALLRLAPFDTVRPAVVSAVWNIEGPAGDSTLSLGSIRLKFSEAMNPDLFKDKANYLCLNSDSTDTIPVVSAAALPGVFDEVSLLTRPLPVDSLFVIFCLRGEDEFGNPLDTLQNTAFVKTAGGTDSLPLQIFPLSFKTGDSSVFCNRPLSFYYSRILSAAGLDTLRAHLVWLIDSTPVPVELEIRDHHTFQASLDPIPCTGEKVIVELLMSGATDSTDREAGPELQNAEPDTTGITTEKKPTAKRIAAFRAANSDDWGKCEFRQKGEVYPWTLQLQHLSMKQTFTRQVKPRVGYIVDSLPAGDYRVSFFLDENQNMRWDPGRLSPWTAQELNGAVEDTLTVTAGKIGSLDLDWPPPALKRGSNGSPTP